MKILELTTYSAGGCGVWARVKRESSSLADRGHTVKVFSTSFTKGASTLAPLNDSIGKVTIQRFPATRLGGESFTYWNFSSEARKYNPDLIIAHAYRHTHTTRALKIARELNIPVFLVTHAPFDRDSTRSMFAKIAVFIYDLLIGPNTLPHFKKIIAITQWELPYLKKIGARSSQLSLIPNGITSEFFKPLIQGGKGIAYTGRIAPIKNLELVIKALARIGKSAPSFKLLGPAEQSYLNNLHAQIKNLHSPLTLHNKVYMSSEQIAFLDASDYFILPSLSEGMPQALVEAMARGKIVIASDNKGNTDIIKNGKNGFLFKNNNLSSLLSILNKVFTLNQRDKKRIRKEARASAEFYKWDVLARKLNSLILQER